MAFDDDKIRIEVDGAQASAQLDALAKDVSDLEAELEKLNNTAGVTSVEINSTTKRLDEARGKYQDAAEAADEYARANEDATKQTKGLIEQVGGVGPLLGIITGTFIASYKATRNAIEALKDYGVNIDEVTSKLWENNETFKLVSQAIIDHNVGMKEDADTTQELANANNILTKRFGESYDSIEAAREALERHSRAAYDDAKALEAASAAIFGNTKKIESHSGAVLLAVQHMLDLGNATEEQMQRGKKAVQDAIDEQLVAFGKVDPALAELAARIGASSSLQEDAAKSLAKEEEALEKAAVKSAQERAKAETKAAEEVVAALAKQEASFLKMLEDTNKFVAERDKILNSPNQGFDSSQDAGKAKDDLAGLNRQIKAIQDSPIVTEDQDQQLRDLQRQARAAADELRDLSGVYTLAAMNGEELAQKQNAAWQKYYAIRHANDAIVQRNVDKDLRALGEQTDAVGELGDSAAGVAGAFSDVADAAGSVGDEAKKGTDKAKEGLSGMVDGLNEALPLAKELRVVLQDIVMLGSQADI